MLGESSSRRFDLSLYSLLRQLCNEHKQPRPGLQVAKTMWTLLEPWAEARGVAVSCPTQYLLYTSGL